LAKLKKERRMNEQALAEAFEKNPLIEMGLPISLAIIMAGVGLTLSLSDFHNVVNYPRALILGSIAQIVLMPAIAFALVYLLAVPPMIAVGLVVIAACPGGTTSNIFTYLAKGNLALSILATILASLITVFSIPLFTNLALRLFTEQNMDEPLRLPVLQTIIMLVLIIFIPVMTGMLIRARNLKLAGRLEGVVGAFGMFVLIVLIGLIVWQTRNHIGFLLVQAGPAVIALNLIGIAIGFGAARLAGHDLRDGLTLAVELGIKNSTIGLMVTLTLLQSAEIAMPAAIYGLLMYVSAIGLIIFGRRLAGASPTPHLEDVPLHVPDSIDFTDHAEGIEKDGEDK